MNWSKLRMGRSLSILFSFLLYGCQKYECIEYRNTTRVQYDCVLVLDSSGVFNPLCQGHEVEVRICNKQRKVDDSFKQ